MSVIAYKVRWGADEYAHRRGGRLEPEDAAVAADLHAGQEFVTSYGKPFTLDPTDPESTFDWLSYLHDDAYWDDLEQEDGPPHPKSNPDIIW